MKKKSVFLALVLFAVGAFAQTERGKIRIGGSSNLGYSSASYNQTDFDGSSNSFFINVHGGYFIVDNLSLEVGVLYGYSWLNSREFGKSYFIQVGGELGFRYYFPMKFFLGSNFDISHILISSFYDPLSNFNVEAGYAWFLSENVALEPAINYHLIMLGLRRYGSRLNVRMGISVHF